MRNLSALTALANLSDNQHAKRSRSDGLTDAEYYHGLPNLPPAASNPKASLLGKVIRAVQAPFNRLSHSKEDLAALEAIVETGIGQFMGELQDDRKIMLLEKVVTALALQESDSHMADYITNSLINVLYNDLDHPPRATLSPAYKYRTVDGSGNSCAHPQLGAGFTAYARSVSAMTPASGARPDTGLTFDLLMRRSEFKPHPGGISSLLFSMANMITHDLFSTKGDQPEINQHSSYLDLQVIYGKTAEENQRVRKGTDGLLHADTFADSRIAVMPPATAALVILFSRHHNYVAHRIRAINEHGNYRSEEELRFDPVLRQKAEAQIERLIVAQQDASATPEQLATPIPTVEEAVDELVHKFLKDQDEEIYGRSRVVNCGFFVACILRDYIPAILNQTASDWFLDPMKEFHNAGPKVPRGAGNHVSAEFSILYRWHAGISAADEKWLNETSEEIWPHTRPEDLTPQEFAAGARKLQSRLGDMKRPDQWSIHGWKRDASTGKFNDWDLASTIIAATKEVAGALGARNNPAWMRIIDIMGQETARNKWGLCSLNEFRVFLGLKTYSSFSEWNSDPEISAAAEMLYSHVDNLELFPGLMAEETKKPGPGAGLCPGYTTSRAILSDATALVRGDRFLTIDMTPAKCTSWGHVYGQSSQPGAFKGIISKLLFNTLPNIFKYNSTFALFPFVTPRKIEKILTEKGVLAEYDTDEPEGQIQNWYGVNSYEATREIVTNSRRFGVPYKAAIEIVAQGKNYVMGMDNLSEHRRNRELLTELAYPTNWQRTFDRFFSQKSAELLKTRSLPYTNGNRIVDVVQEVCNVVPMLYAAQRFGLILREPGEHVGFSVQELTMQLQAQFALIFDVSYSFSGAATWEAREASALTGKLIYGQIQMRYNSFANSGTRFLTNSLAKMSDIIGSIADDIRPSPECEEMYRKLYESGCKPADAFSYVHGLCVSSVPTISHSASLLVEFYLREENVLHKERIIELCGRRDDEATALLRGYVNEALRLNGMAPVIPRTVLVDHVQIQDGDTLKTFNQGDGIMASQKNANLDPEIFENPLEINPERPRSAKSLNFGAGMHECLGAQMAMIALPAILRAVFSLPNIRLAPGKAGQFETIPNVMPGGTIVTSFVKPTGQEWPFATNLKVIYDDYSVDTVDGSPTVVPASSTSSGYGSRARSRTGQVESASPSISRGATLRRQFRSSGGSSRSWSNNDVWRASLGFRPKMTKSYSVPHAMNGDEPQ
ncbi:hypothetical protein A4X09_0g4768 [Tilletia walkeri]|uniref:linoleate 8R-lipoxygenase n=1 Tax=Tilletia walkeri TaxID=117179 RepID=A0A8X7N728_9BASI|nr:hypothetical protein A4X09_0g4768 [Tilletia walkeri]